MFSIQVYLPLLSLSPPDYVLLETKQITLLATTGRGPSPRYYSLICCLYLLISPLSFLLLFRYAMSSITYGNNIYVFGGYDSEGFICDDLFKLDTGITFDF